MKIIVWIALIAQIDFGTQTLQKLTSASQLFAISNLSRRFWPELGPKSPILDSLGGAQIGQSERSEQSESRF